MSVTLPELQFSSPLPLVSCDYGEDARQGSCAAYTFEAFMAMLLGPSAQPLPSLAEQPPAAEANGPDSPGADGDKISLSAGTPEDSWKQWIFATSGPVVASPLSAPSPAVVQDLGVVLTAAASGLIEQYGQPVAASRSQTAADPVAGQPQASGPTAAPLPAAAGPAAGAIFAASQSLPLNAATAVKKIAETIGPKTDLTGPPIEPPANLTGRLPLFDALSGEMPSGEETAGWAPAPPVPAFSGEADAAGEAAAPASAPAVVVPALPTDDSGTMAESAALRPAGERDTAPAIAAARSAAPGPASAAAAAATAAAAKAAATSQALPASEAGGIKPGGLAQPAVFSDPAVSLPSQVVKQLDLNMVKPDQAQRLTLQLEPEQLGRVEVEITARGDRLTVTLKAESPAAVQALRDGLPELTRALSGKQEYRWSHLEIRIMDAGDSGRAPDPGERDDDERPRDEQRRDQEEGRRREQAGR